MIWTPLTLQMSLKIEPSLCCHVMCSDISGSSMMATDPGSAWNSRL